MPVEVGLGFEHLLHWHASKPPAGTKTEALEMADALDSEVADQLGMSDFLN